MADTDLIAQFVFTLARASTRTVVLSWETRDGTAVENVDYVPASGQLIFAPGELSKAVDIQVLQPPTEERKFFTVVITEAVNATVDATEPGQVVITPNNVFRGPRGYSGGPGPRGPSTYEEAIANGSFTGTYEEWVAYLKVSSADNISFTQSGSGAATRDVSKKLKDTLAVRDYQQVAPGSDDTIAVQASINEALERGSKTIEVDDALAVPGALVDRSNVFFRGEGELSGDGAYRRQVFPWNAQSARQVFNDLVPARHLKAFSVAKSPVVVLTGSSTGGWAPDSVDVSSTFVRMLSDKIARYNPDKTIKLYNRAIGAQTYAQLDTIPVTFPNWYTDHGKPWLDYIKDVAPDVVFIIMGSNDSSGMSYDSLKSVTDKLKAFLKVPDIVFITQPSVCPDPHPSFASSGTKAGQEGRDYAAGLIRSWAAYNDHGLIDGNRAGGLVLDGRDILETIAKRLYTNVDLTLNGHGGGYVSDDECHDFSMRVTFTGDLAAIDAAFTAAGNPSNPVSFRIGAGLNGSRGGDIVFLRKSPTGKFLFNFFTKANVGNNYSTITTTVDFPTGPFSLDIFKVGNTLGVSVTDSEETTFMQFPIIVHGGLFKPQIQYYTSGGGPFTFLTFLNIGEPMAYLPALTAEQAWGKKNQFAVRQLPYGGNGVNHFSSLGTAFIYGPLLNRQVLTSQKSDSGIYTPVITPGVNVTAGATANGAMWTRHGEVVTVSGSFIYTPTATGNTLVDLSLPVVSDILGSADLAGTAGVGGVASMNGSVWGNDVANTARVQINAPVNTQQTVRYSYSYRIRA